MAPTPTAKVRLRMLPSSRPSWSAPTRSGRAERFQRLPIELHAVAGAVGSNGLAVADLQGMGDEALEPEAVHLEIGRVRDRGEEVDVEVVDAVRGHREVVGFRDVGDLEPRRHAADVRDV